MQRRDLLQSMLALAAAGLPAPALLLSAPASADLRKLGKPQPFDYAWLKGQARALSGQPYQPRTGQIPDKLSQMSWDQWQAIQFKEDHSLWREQKLNAQVRFFHLGWHMTTPVRIHEVVDGQAQELAYDPAMFDYGRSGISGGSLPKDLGFAGFRVLYHTDWVRDVAAFQGASYFRAVDGDLQYGMSARGLAVDSGLDPEEFPVFTSYWLERPAPNSDSFYVYALLDSKSVTGAYRFLLTLGDTLVMDVDAALYPRRAIERIGIAPLTSMFQYGENDRRRANDWRPEIHDADGLQMLTGGGEWIWRPVVNPAGVRTNSYYDDNPRGFGLLQRDRDFDHYQDDGVFYDKRPSLWIEPRSGPGGAGWGKGAVMLVELPTDDETNDNIVVFWNPAEKPQPGQELLYSYRMYWCRTPPLVPRLATVRATRTGIGGVVGQKHTYFSWRFVVDFAGGNLAMLGSQAKVEAVIEASRGKVEITSARPLAAINGYRAMFDLRPTDDSTEPVNLRLYLSCDGQPLTETWLYQWTPPPPGERKFF
ncbi:MAG: glucan biosynthesis protein D [Nevskia sp.]|nr:glucan biosynthesis protein D [Nevskia sp.]